MLNIKGVKLKERRDYMSRLQKPGETPKRAGQYIETGPRGGKVKKPRSSSISRSTVKLPPTAEENRKWKRTGPKK